MNFLGILTYDYFFISSIDHYFNTNFGSLFYKIGNRCYIKWLKKMILLEWDMLVVLMNYDQKIKELEDRIVKLEERNKKIDRQNKTKIIVIIVLVVIITVIYYYVISQMLGNLGNFYLFYL